MEKKIISTFDFKKGGRENWIRVHTIETDLKDKKYYLEIIKRSTLQLIGFTFKTYEEMIEFRNKLELNQDGINKKIFDNDKFLEHIGDNL